MTYSEVLDIEGEYDRIVWDGRWWLFSQKSDKVMETYQSLVDEKKDAPVDFDSLPPERKSWYKNR